MKVKDSEILILARDFLKSHRWIKNDVLLGSDGNTYSYAEEMDRNNASCEGVCALGALEAVCYKEQYDYYHVTSYLSKAISELTDGVHRWVDTYNDLKVTRKADILKVYDKAIQLAKKDEE